MKKCRNISWPEFHSIPPTKEEEHMINIARVILLPLCSDVVLEKRYVKKIAICTELRAEHIGMGYGTNDTWHGTPDRHVRGCSNLYNPGTDNDRSSLEGTTTVLEAKGNNPGMDDDRSPVSSDETEGTTTALEAKGHIKFWDTIDQLVITTVTSLFIEHGLHPYKNTLVLTIIADPIMTQACLCNCQHDVLLVSLKGAVQQEGRNFQYCSLLSLAYYNHRISYISTTLYMAILYLGSFCPHCLRK